MLDGIGCLPRKSASQARDKNTKNIKKDMAAVETALAGRRAVEAGGPVVMVKARHGSSVMVSENPVGSGYNGSPASSTSALSLSLVRQKYSKDF
jgi:hypothetical protein